MNTKILIADDHQVLVQGLRLLLETEPYLDIVGTASSGKAALEKVATLNPDVVLLDINMPDMDGIETCKILKETYSSLKVIALTSFNDESLIRRMMDNGAQGYLLKNAGKAEILQAIRTVMKGGIYYSSEVSETLLQALKEPKRKNTSHSGIVPKLTRREKEILQLISQEFTTPEIAEKLSLSPKTVENHRYNLMGKFEVKNVVGLIRSAMRLGLLEE